MKTQELNKYCFKFTAVLKCWPCGFQGNSSLESQHIAPQELQPVHFLSSARQICHCPQVGPECSPAELNRRGNTCFEQFSVITIKVQQQSSEENKRFVDKITCMLSGFIEKKDTKKASEG